MRATSDDLWASRGAVTCTHQEIDELLRVEWTARMRPPERHDPSKVLRALHASRGGLARCQAFVETTRSVNQLMRSQELSTSELAADDLAGSARRAAEQLAHEPAMRDAPERAVQRAQLLELLLSIAEVAGPNPPQTLDVDPFAPSRLSVSKPYTEGEIDWNLIRLVLEYGKRALDPGWPAWIIAGDHTELWPHALLMQRAHHAGRRPMLARAALRVGPEHARCAVESGTERLLKMLVRFGHETLATFVAGASLRIVNADARPVEVELYCPDAQPEWWGPRCRDLLCLAACRQIAIVAERFGEDPHPDAVVIAVPSEAWRPSDGEWAREVGEGDRR